MTATATAADAAREQQLRDAMTDKLVKNGLVASPRIETALRTVPRHAFARPGTPLEECYSGKIVRNKKGPDGATLSSVSAAWLQARMIAQAGIGPGARVLEIGTTGYNACLIAEVAGPGGKVVTVDIDDEVASWAAAALDATGYSGRVIVRTGDGEDGAPGHGPFDAIIVTAGAWEIAPAWISQLRETGTLVVPLRMNGVTRSLGFRKQDGRLASTTSCACGFVPLTGAGRKAETFFRVPGPGGGHATLRFEDGAPAAPPVDAGVLAGQPVTSWSGLTVPDQETAWSDFYLWLASRQEGFCRLDQDGGPQLADGGPAMRTGWFPFAVALDGSLSYLTVRGTPEGGFEFGAVAYGDSAGEAAAALTRHLHAWDARGRDLPGNAFAYWPGDRTPELPADRAVSVFRKHRGTLTATWEPERAAGKGTRR